MLSAEEEKKIGLQGYRFVGEQDKGAGFSLIELLVVLAVVSVLTGIMLPVLGSVRRRARTLRGMSRQRQIASAVNLYAMDNDGRYPESVAKSGSPANWGWEAPTLLTNYDLRSGLGPHRAVSGYLGRYIGDASIMFCPSAPCRYEHLQESWDAGDDWNNPDTGGMADPVYGTYCFYWNYNGYLGGGRRPFKGPLGPASRGEYSRLLVSDYLGYGSWRGSSAYFSCERFKRGDIDHGWTYYSALWSVAGPVTDGSLDAPEPDMSEIKLNAAYTDGHVEAYTPSEAVPMWVSTTPDGATPDTVGPGIFYLPPQAVR
jgi:prepilin-type N-terminal cleavage/methylation domain-containing protein